MSRIEIILSLPSQTEAYREALRKDNELLRSEFFGPIFADAKYKFTAFGIEVHVDGAVYAYPAHAISRVKVTAAEEN